MFNSFRHIGSMMEMDGFYPIVATSEPQLYLSFFYLRSLGVHEIQTFVYKVIY